MGAALWIVGLCCAALVVTGFGLGIYLPNLHNGLIAASFTAVGLFVVGMRPGNREGRLFIATGLAHAVMFFGRQYGFFTTTHEDEALPGVAWVTWLGVWPLALVLVLTGVTLMSFPDGRLPSPRWRVLVAAMVAVALPVALASALWPAEYAENRLAVPHPLHVGGYDAALRLWGVVGPVSYLAFQVAWVVCVVVRMRRARGDEARQLRWFAYAVVMAAAAMVVGLVAFGSAALGVLAVPVVPLAAGVAILKYRLYDIDLVINKTLVVGTMAVIITAGYVAVVGAQTCVVQSRPGNPMHLEPGRLRHLVEQARGASGYIICHSTLPYYQPGTRPAICRGSAERYSTWQLQVMQRLWGFVEVDPPTPPAVTDAPRETDNPRQRM